MFCHILQQPKPSFVINRDILLITTTPISRYKEQETQLCDKLPVTHSASAELSQKVPVTSFIPNTAVWMWAFRCKVGLGDIDSDITTTTFRTALRDSKVAATATTSNVKSNVMCERFRSLLHLVIQLCQLPLWKSRMKRCVQPSFRMQILQKRELLIKTARLPYLENMSKCVVVLQSTTSTRYWSELTFPNYSLQPVIGDRCHLVFFPSAPLPVPGPHTLTSFASSSVRQSATVVLYLKRPFKRPRSWANFEILDRSYQQNSPNHF